MARKARGLRRAQIRQGVAMEDAAQIEALRDMLQGMVHLTTRYYPAHRRRILADVRARRQVNPFAAACRSAIPLSVARIKPDPAGQQVPGAVRRQRQ